MKLFRIQHPNGTYSAGGMLHPRFSKGGKVWQGQGPFANHLAQYKDPLKFYKECVLVVIDEEEQTFTRTDFLEWWNAYSAEKQRKEDVRIAKVRAKRELDAIQKGVSS